MNRALPAAVLLAAVALTGCAATDADERPHVVVTTNILGDVTEQIVGSAATVTTLMKPNADPHSFGISAREAATLQSADLVVSSGFGLEEGIEQHLESAADAGAPRFVATDHIDPVAYTGDASGPDPHFWTDPERMIDVVHALEDALGSAGIEVSADDYIGELERLDADMAAAFAAIPAEHRALVTNHHVFGYLADRYGFELIGAVIPGGSTLASPSASDLEDLATAIETSGVPAIFAESSQPDRLMQVLRSEAQIEVDVVELFTESLTEPGGGADTYLTMMRENTERIATALSR
ncbi:ABC transporter substrate-binding protein [Microbacterium nanhaiense]|uniref:ABC transporter substrate-binding protein n=1 Tax=Microbacterium nanhaiense TaxID=1301026 RepID=A0ABQ2N4G7_9MICO|nr:zinc ABC transporter substrate-binding protein AztC [Microbacterium nanhaiense]GGO65410.1 ABC transporter substrate-binding protein [Microbacterium nanhaiense]